MHNHNRSTPYGFMTGILYMAPADLSGVNLCPMADMAGCKAACLNSAGRGAMSNVQRARLSKARFFIEQRAAFMRVLVADIERLVRSAKRKGMTPLVRLNGTTDIRWETIKTDDGRTIFDRFPGVQFYDYTKIANRRDIPANYDLTFSWSGVGAFPEYAKRAISAGMRVAVVFRDRGTPAGSRRGPLRQGQGQARRLGLRRRSRDPDQTRGVIESAAASPTGLSSTLSQQENHHGILAGRDQHQDNDRPKV